MADLRYTKSMMTNVIGYWRRRVTQLPNPILLGRAFLMPFVYVVGGSAILLGIAGAAIGLNPVEVSVDFLAKTGAVLIPMVLKLLVIWLVYTAVYMVAILRYELAVAIPVSCALEFVFKVAAPMRHWDLHPTRIVMPVHSPAHQTSRSVCKLRIHGWEAGLPPQQE